MNGNESLNSMENAAALTPETFSSLVHDYSRMVFAVCRRMLGNDADACDAAQDCFEAVARGARMPRGVPAGAWLHGIAANRCRMRLRSESRRRAREEAYMREHVPPTDSAWNELYPLLDEALLELPEDLRVPVAAHFLEARTHRDIARDLGISRRAAGYRIARGVEQLAALLRQRGVFLPVAAVSATLAAHGADAAPIPAALQISLGKLALAYSVKTAASTAAAISASPWLLFGGVSIMKKTIATLSAMLVIACLLYGAYQGWVWWRRPYSPMNITATPQFNVKREASKRVEAPRVQEADAEKTSTAAAPIAPVETPAAATEPAAYAFVAGIVLTGDGQPVPGARVALANDTVRSPLEMAHPPKQPIALSTTTDAQGQFQFDGIPLEVAWAKDIPRYTLTAEADNQAVLRTFAGNQIQREWYFELTLDAVESLSGRVVDDAGKPVPEASLNLCGNLLDNPNLPARSGNNRAYTDAAGYFEFPYLSPGQYLLNVTAKGFIVLLMSPWLRTGQDGIVLVLERGKSISGHVIDTATGLPLTSGEIVAAVDAPKIRNDRSNNRDGSASLDASGCFDISGLIPGRYALRLQGGGDGKSPYCLEDPPLADLTSVQSVAGLELKATAGAVLAGTVLDAVSGKPVAGARIEALQTANLASGGADSEETGAFRMEGLPGGAFTLKTKHREYEEQSTRIELSTGETRDGIAIRLSHLPGLHGHVVDDSGVPVAGAAVASVVADDRLRTVSGISDTSGAFALYYDYEPPWYTQAPRAAYVQALYGSYLSPRIGPFSLKDTDRDIIVTVAPAGRIEGTVVDLSGKAIPNACISVVSNDTSAANIIVNGWNRSSRREDSSDRAFTFTMSTGLFSFDALVPARYELQVYLPTSPQDLPITTANVSVAGGETVYTNLTVDTGAFGAVEGVVTVQGAPAPNQMVMAGSDEYDWNQHTLDTMTDASGHYRLENVLAGEVQVTLPYRPDEEGMATSQIVLKQTVTVSPGETAAADFDVPFTATYVEGVVTSNGTPEFSATILFNREDGSEEGNASVFTDATGYYKAGLAEGAYSVDLFRIRPEGCISTKRYATVEAVAGETVRLDIAFGGGVIEGVLEGLAPGEKGYVALLPPDTSVAQWTPQALMALSGAIIRSMDVPGNGPFQWQDLEPGAYLLAAAGIPRDAAIEPATFLNAKIAFIPVDVAEGKPTPVTVTVQ